MNGLLLQRTQGVQASKQLWCMLRHGLVACLVAIHPPLDCLMAHMFGTAQVAAVIARLDRRKGVACGAT